MFMSCTEKWRRRRQHVSFMVEKSIAKNILKRR